MKSKPKKSNKIAFITEDEAWNIPSNVGSKLERWLEGFEFDSCNKQYVIIVELLPLK